VSSIAVDNWAEDSQMQVEAVAEAIAAVSPSLENVELAYLGDSEEASTCSPLHLAGMVTYLRPSATRPLNSAASLLSLDLTSPLCQDRLVLDACVTVSPCSFPLSICPSRC
jgi:hypothetical protein